MISAACYHDDLDAALQGVDGLRCCLPVANQNSSVLEMGYVYCCGHSPGDLNPIFRISHDMN
jgi:hypothetical protein